MYVLLAGIRGEDAGMLVCYKKEDDTREEDKARLELRVMGIASLYTLCAFGIFTRAVE